MIWTERHLRVSLALLAVGFALIPAGADEGDPPPPLRLVRADGRPVAHARVSVVGRAGAVATDAEGIFHLVPEPPAPFDLAVFGEDGGWLGVIRVQQLAREGIRELLLPPVRSFEVTVRGGVAPETFAPPAAAAAVVSLAENEKRQPSRLIDVLAEVPGTSRVGNGQGAVPSVRGLARGRTLLLLDDGRVTSERRAGPSATFLDPFSVESVEVVRGPGSVVYGSDALGGIIHARTPVPRAGQWGGRWEVAGGAGFPERRAGVEVNVPLGKSALLAQGHWRDFGDYDAPGGTVANSQAGDRGALLKGLWPVGGARWILGLQADQARDVGKPRVGTGTLTRYPREDSTRFTAGAKLPAVGGLTDLELQAFYGTYRLVTDRQGDSGLERSDVTADDASLRLVASRSVSRGLVRFGLDASGRVDLAAETTRSGVDAGGQPFATVTSSIESASRRDVGLFVEGERSVGPIGSVAGGLRAQGVWTDNEGGAFGNRSTSDESLSGYLAWTVRPRRLWTARFQVARGFREPLLSDRYFVGVTGRGTITGNPGLRPETSVQLDASVERNGTLTRFAAYAYRYRIQDLIERFEVTAEEFAFRNRGREELRGLELELDLRVGSTLSARVTAGTAKGRIADDDSPAADVPPTTLGLSFVHRPRERVWWRVAYDYVLEDDDPGPSETRTPGYGVLDGSVGFSPVEGTELRLVLRNVLDKPYPASPDDDAVAAPGFAAALVLAGRF